MLNRCVLFVLLVGFSLVGHAQQLPSTDPQSSAVIAGALQALTGGTTIGDFRATGSVDWINEKGSVTLRMMGVQGSRLDLVLSAGQQSFVRNDADGRDCGVFIDGSGGHHSFARHQCWTPAAWFAPLAWINVAASPDAIMSYVGSETRNGVDTDHIHIYRDFPNQPKSPRALLKSLTTFDIYLDSKSHLPVAVTFYDHPNDNAGGDMPAEIRFSGYQKLTNAMVPYRIQRRLNGSQFIDITLSDVSINSGLEPTDFQLW
jgi:hypothetical protein